MLAGILELSKHRTSQQKFFVPPPQGWTSCISVLLLTLLFHASAPFGSRYWLEGDRALTQLFGPWALRNSHEKLKTSRCWGCCLRRMSHTAAFFFGQGGRMVSTLLLLAPEVMICWWELVGTSLGGVVINNQDRFCGHELNLFIGSNWASKTTFYVTHPREFLKCQKTFFSNQRTDEVKAAAPDGILASINHYYINSEALLWSA